MLGSGGAVAGEGRKKEVVSEHAHLGKSQGFDSSKPGSSQIQVYQRSRGRSSRFSQVRGDSVLGVFPGLTTKGVMGSAQIVSSVSKGESASASDSFSVIGSGVVSSDMQRFRDSPQVDEELNFVMETGGVAGLSCRGQIGKLEEVLGQLVAEKQGRVTGGERGSHDFNES
jgi:hypothetical protein